MLALMSGGGGGGGQICTDTRLVTNICELFFKCCKARTCQFLLSHYYTVQPIATGIRFCYCFRLPGLRFVMKSSGALLDTDCRCLD